MNYGPHTSDVQDLVDLIDSGQLLRNPQLPRDPSVKIIHDPAEVEQYRELPPEAPDDACGWRDIVEFGGMCGLGSSSDFPSEKLDRLEPELIDTLNDLYDGHVQESLRRQLSGRCPEGVISSIWEDFTFIIGDRAAFGRTVPFIERLIDLYRVGGFPCGWDGLYPEGRMVVYFPLEGEE
jgi:hypothetical protein